MTTPAASIPHDLEQVIKDLQSALGDVTAASLRRKQLSVTEGDFVVTGGGGVYIREGGKLVATYPTGEPAVYYGPITPNNGVESYGLAVVDKAGNVIFAAFADPDGGDTVKTVQCDAKLLSLSGDNIIIGPDAGGGTLVMDPTSMSVQNFNGDVNIVSTGRTNVNAGGYFHIQQIPTTASAPNAYLSTIASTYGRLAISTSSRRYKENIVPLGIDPETVLALEPKTFTRKDEADQDNPPIYPGFIAEEAADLGLHGWVTPDQDGKPEQFAYATWCVAQQVVLRQQADQIKTLNTQVADLTARLEKLEKATP